MPRSSQLYAMNLGPELTADERARLLPFIPEEKRARINKFYHWQDAQRTLLGYSMISYLLTREFGLEKEKICFHFDEYGKPRIEEKEVFFNLSHAGEWIVCGISHKIIGVDVEQITAIDLTLAERFFAPVEVADLFQLPRELRDDYFFKLWTLKESYIKAEGRGISIPLNSFWFQLFQDEIIFSSESTQDWQFKLYNLDRNHQLAVCLIGKGLPKQVQFLTQKALVQELS